MSASRAQRIPEGNQHIIRRSRTYFLLPFAILGLLVVDLVCEIVRINTELPLPQLLNVQSAASIIAVATGLVLARGQFAISARPRLGVRFTTDDVGNNRVQHAHDEPLPAHLYVFNAGSGTATVQSIDYRVNPRRRLRDLDSSDWVARREVRQELKDGGFVEGKDFFIMNVGTYPLPSVSKPFDGVHLLSLSATALYAIESIDVRLRIIDSVGDLHERVIRDYVADHQREVVDAHFGNNPTPRIP